MSPPIFKFEIKRFLHKNYNLNIKEFNGIPKSLEKLGYNKELTTVKKNIENIEKKEWGQIRKLINPFDFPNINSPKLRIFNRAFYKMWELINEFSLLEPLYNNNDFSSFHLCEAPAGFIQSIIYYYKLNKHPNENIEEENSNDGFQVVHNKRNKNKNGIQYHIDTISLDRINQDIPNYHEIIVNNKNGI